MIDEIARSHGHEVIRTPLYHPELQPIETCWGVVKNHVASKCDFTMDNLIKQLDSGFSKVTAETCSKIIAKVRKVEEKFWTEDLENDSPTGRLRLCREKGSFENVQIKIFRIYE
jgi:hypothetical protein